MIVLAVDVEKKLGVLKLQVQFQAMRGAIRHRKTP